MKDMKHRGYKEEFSVFGEADAQDPDPEVRKRFAGKYRGTVRANLDPLRQGRLLVCVPDVTGFFTSNWALPCVPMAGPGVGTYFAPPVVGSNVWVEFEQGDSERPIWVGCFWGPGEIPLLAQACAPGSAAITNETLASGISICDAPVAPFGGCINLHSGTNFISIGPQGVIISAPTVTVKTSAFSVNGTALSVLGPA
jgi:hypothetical protein